MARLHRLFYVIMRELIILRNITIYLIPDVGICDEVFAIDL